MALREARRIRQETSRARVGTDGFLMRRCTLDWRKSATLDGKSLAAGARIRTGFGEDSAVYSFLGMCFFGGLGTTRAGCGFAVSHSSPEKNEEWGTQTFPGGLMGGHPTKPRGKVFSHKQSSSEFSVEASSASKGVCHIEK